MRKEIQNLMGHITTLYEQKLEILKTLDDLRTEALSLENQGDSEINWSYVLQDLTSELNNLTPEMDLSFIDDLEECVNDLTFKEQAAIKKMRESVNPLFKNVPVYFDAANPPLLTDYKKDKK